MGTTGSASPGPASVRLPRDVADAIEAHARAEAPNEACGLVPGTGLAAEGGAALRYVACRNATPSPVRYTVHPDDVYRVLRDVEEAGEVVWAMVHSHTTRPAVPSRTDVGMASWWPDALWIVVSLADRPALRAWRIVGDEAHEVAVEAA